MNNSAYNMIQKLIEDSFQYWDEVHDEFGITKDDGLTSMTIWSVHDIYNDPEVESILKNEASHPNMHGVMTTCIYCLGEEGYENKEDAIVTGTLNKVYMSFQELFELVIDCHMDYDKALESMKYLIRHEIGHILSYREMFVGKRYGESQKYNDELEAEYENVPKLRKNASLKSRKTYSLAYMHVTHERLANEAVGITDEDIIADFNRRNGGVY